MACNTAGEGGRLGAVDAHTSRPYQGIRPQAGVRRLEDLVEVYDLTPPLLLLRRCRRRRLCSGRRRRRRRRRTPPPRLYWGNANIYHLSYHSFI